MAGEPLSFALLQRDIALHMDAGAKRNRLALRRLNRMLQVASSLVAIEIVACVISLVSAT